MAANGALTTDNIPLQQLYTLTREGVEMFNQNRRDWRSLLCEETTQKSVVVAQQAATYQRLGDDTTKPDMQHVDRRTIDLAEPVPYGLGEAITRRMVQRGISSGEIQRAQRDALSGANRVIAQTCLAAAMQKGGFWDATQTKAPPRYKNNTFTTSHTHFRAENVSGVPKLEYFEDARNHIAEHGYETDFVHFINTAQRARIVKTAEWVAAANTLPTSVMDGLQRVGLTPAFEAAGVPVVVEDWVPANYILSLSLQEKPLYWRKPEGTARDGGLQVFGPPPDAEYAFIEEYTIFVSATVVLKGAGHVCYLNSGTWANPSFSP